MSTMVKIAVIDDGINSSALLSEHKIYHFYVSKDCRVLPVKRGVRSISHGTICGGIILSNICVDCEIISIKVKRINQNGNIEKLYAALNYCLKSGVDIVNLSLGTRDVEDATMLYKIILQMEKKKIIVVSAMDNNPREKAFPACFDNVIGVRHSMKACRGIYWIDNNTVSASGVQTIKITATESYTTFACNSYATSYVTSQVANLLSDNQGISFRTIMNRLDDIAVNRKHGCM